MENGGQTERDDRFFRIENNWFGFLELGSYDVKGSRSVFLKYTDAIDTFLKWLKSDNGKAMTKEFPKSKYEIFKYSSKKLEKDVQSKGQVVFKLSAKEVAKMQDEFFFKKGGALSKEFKFDKNFVVYVPSTSNVGDKISKKELDKRVDEVENYVANEFGGYTETDTDGGYKSTTGEIIEEDIVKVSVFANNKDWNKNESKVVAKVKEWATRWGQEAIGFEFEGDLYYIDEAGKFEKGGVAPSKEKLSGVKDRRYFSSISEENEGKTREISTTKSEATAKKPKINTKEKEDYGLDYLYNQLKISRDIYENSSTAEDSNNSLLRLKSIQKLIDNRLMKSGDIN